MDPLKWKWETKRKSKSLIIILIFSLNIDKIHIGNGVIKNDDILPVKIILRNDGHIRKLYEKLFLGINNRLKIYIDIDRY